MEISQVQIWTLKLTVDTTRYPTSICIASVSLGPKFQCASLRDRRFSNFGPNGVEPFGKFETTAPNDSKWTWTLLGQRHTAYVILMFLNPKFHSTSVYGQLFLGYYPIWRQVSQITPQWPEHYKVRHVCCTKALESQISVCFALRSGVFKLRVKFETLAQKWTQNNLEQYKVKGARLPCARDDRIWPWPDQGQNYPNVLYVYLSLEPQHSAPFSLRSITQVFFLYYYMVQQW